VWVNPLCQGGKNEREALRKNAMRKVRKKSIYTVHIEYKKQQQHYRSKGKELAGRIGTTGKKKSG